MRHYISLGLIILLSGCAMTKNYYPQTVQSWNGSSDQKLTKKWGKPDKLMTSQNGNAVLLYKSSNYSPGNMGNTSPCITSFEVNKKGVIVDAKYQGKGCFRDANFAYYNANPDKGVKA